MINSHTVFSKLYSSNFGVYTSSIILCMRLLLSKPAGRGTYLGVQPFCWTHTGYIKRCSNVPIKVFFNRSKKSALAEDRGSMLGDRQLVFQTQLTGQDSPRPERNYQVRGKRGKYMCTLIFFLPLGSILMMLFFVILYQSKLRRRISQPYPRPAG